MFVFELVWFLHSFLFLSVFSPFFAFCAHLFVVFLRCRRNEAAYSRAADGSLQHGRNTDQLAIRGVALHQGPRQIRYLKKIIVINKNKLEIPERNK